MKQINYHFPKEVTQRVKEIIEPFKRIEEWKALEVPGVEIPTATILLVGKPGTGKTTLAKQVLKQVSGLQLSKIPMLSMGDVAHEKLGQTERAIKSAFSSASGLATKNQCVPVLFIDECDAIGWSRDHVVNSSMFMLSIVNTLLMEIDRFMEKGGVICFATNHANLLDPALIRRMTDTITLSPPIGEDAKKVWESLMPAKPFGFAITPEVYANQWTPNEIQKYILAEARAAFLAKRNMKKP